MTSPSPSIESGRKLSSNSAKISWYGLRRMLARTLSRPRWAMPRTISRDAQVGGLLDDGVEDRDERLGPFEREPLLAEVAGVQELLEQLGVVQAS